jgi:hypothetical protein
MRTLITAALLTACATDTPPPSCDQALTHVYDVSGCMFVDSTGSAVPKATIISECVQTAAALPSNCVPDLNAWLECSNGTPAHATTAQCQSCEGDFMTLAECH